MGQGSRSTEARTDRPHRRSSPSRSPTSARWSLLWPLVTGAAGAVIVASRLTGIPQVTPITQLIAFYPASALIWIAIAVAALPARKWLLLSVSLVVAPVILVTAWPDDTDSPAHADGTRLRVVASNVYVGKATRPLVDRIAAESVQPDVVLIEECTEACEQVLTAEPMANLYPYRHIDAQPGARGAAILSRTPLTDTSPLVRSTAFDDNLAMPAAKTTIAGQSLAIKVAHPFPPVPFDLGQWRSDLDRLAQYAATTDGLLIMGGDFNATRYHQPFRSIMNAGLSDALSTDAGTWPSDLPAAIAAPIDHILFRAPLAVLDSGVWTIDSSDHRTVWADLDLPA